ncbi:MAG: hypothetical protein HKN41_00215 [Ilumatobacter sp.]|nr:hypothetical protein [Ilumatobacter sp.]
MSNLAATELVAPSGVGRMYTARRPVRLGDVSRGGRLRLDAIARYLQDVATDDALDAGLVNAMGWVVRRTMFRVEGPPALNDVLELTTCCTGSGRSWAERRTSIRGQSGSIEAVSSWIQVDTTTGRPLRLDDGFFDSYGESAAGRRVSPSLTLPAPPPDQKGWACSFRVTDLDPFGHVNNAAQWAMLIELLGCGAAVGTFEIEYICPVDIDDRLSLVVDGTMAWLVADGSPRTAFRWSPPSGT